MKLERKAASGPAARMSSMRSRKRSPSPHRRMRRTSGADTCCSERSKYGTPVARMASTSRVGEVGRVEVEQPHPRHPRRHRLDQRDDRLGAHALVAAVAGQVLGDEHDLLGAAGDELVDLVEDLVDRPRALRAAEARDGAEAARLVAALGHLHVGPRGGRPAGGAGSAGRSWAAAGAPRLAAEGDGHAEAGDRVDLGQGLGQLVAVALGHAAGDDELGAVRLAVGQARARCRSTPGGPPR